MFELINFPSFLNSNSFQKSYSLFSPAPIQRVQTTENSKVLVINADAWRSFPVPRELDTACSVITKKAWILGILRNKIHALTSFLEQP
jgi:hypothetical protein